MTIDCRQIAESLQLRPEQVAGCVALLDEGNTVPFITRYRKERTGNLDEEQIRRIRDLMTAQRQLQERAANIIRLIDSRGQLTAELRAAIEQAETLKRLEDLYLPFRPKRTSRAEQARERGLEPLAIRVRQGDPALEDLETAAAPFLNPEQELHSTEDVLRGVHDIIAEQIGDDPDVRSVCRRVARQTGRLEVRRTKKAADKDQEFRDYFEYDESIRGIPPHRVLAVNRGEKAGVLKVRFRWDDTRARVSVQMQLRTPDHRFAAFLEECVADAISRLILPSLEREVRRELNEQAESHAVTVFARNLRNLLLQPPVRDRRVLAIDPGFRTGCKLAMLDGLGNPLMTGITHVTGSVEKKAAARRQIADLLREHDCRLIAIGNGTACRETEELVAEVIATDVEDAAYVIVNEAGASVYSTSPAARDEFPDSDATVRGTISIGRRLQDPLSELVKIDAQHLGVGMYQHDLNERRLKEQLTEVIESCVNYVGVDLNTASTSLLKHVSGLNQLIARRVVEWRKVHGRFENRQQLLDVQGVGEATFTQAAGFLQISDGDEPLDSTWIHPESYPAARSLLERAQVDAAQLTASGEAAAPAQETLRELDARETATELAIGLPTFQDMLDALLRPGRDPRVELPEPLFRKGVLKLEDLEIGMELTGTVLNVVDFGAFIDVGLKDSGLVHISQMASDFVHSPHDRVCVGERATVWVLDVDLERRRVSLTMIPPEDSPTTGSRQFRCGCLLRRNQATAMPETVRAFVALPVDPPPPLRSQLRKISTPGRVVRAVRPESLHITLRFLGDIPVEQIPAVAAAVRQATDGAEQVPLQFRGLGAFPTPERPAVLWAGLEQAAPVEALAARLAAALEAAGIPPDRRGFRPHLTLARIRARPPAEVFELLATHTGTDYGQSIGQTVVLYQSELRPAGARHVPLETVPLAPAVGDSAS